MVRPSILRHLLIMSDPQAPGGEEFEAFLREERLDPDLVRAEQVKMAKFKRTPEEVAKPAAERAEL